MTHVLPIVAVWQNPSRTHDAWRMYGKRNRARLEGRIQARRQEFRDRGITILEESTIRSRPGNRTRGSDASAPDVATTSPRASTSAAGQGSPSGSVRRKTRRRLVTDDGVEEDGVDYSGDEDAYGATDDGNEPGTSRKGKGKARHRTRRSLQGSTVDAAGGRGGKRRQSVSGSQVSRGSVVNDEEEPDRYVPSDTRLTAESCIHPHGQPDRGGMKLMFSLDDRVALVQLLAKSGPNPSPSDLLRFAARVCVMFTHCDLFDQPFIFMHLSTNSTRWKIGSASAMKSTRRCSRKPSSYVRCRHRASCTFNPNHSRLNPPSGTSTLTRTYEMSPVNRKTSNSRSNMNSMSNHPLI